MAVFVKPDGSTVGFAADNVSYTLALYQEALEPFYDLGQEPDLQTDKKQVKLCPCTSCKRPVVVNVFYAAAIAKCRACRGTIADQGGAPKGSQAIVQVGRTDPALAKNLSDCLINNEFAELNCVKCGEPMELKSVSHNDNYGPSVLHGYNKQGHPEYRKIADGETVMHQCNHCRLVVTMSTTAQAVYRRQNEPRTKSTHEANVWGEVNGAREAIGEGVAP